MSETIVWHESQVYKLPDDISLKKGCLLEPVSIAVRMMDKIDMKLGCRVAICGGGPIGLLGLQAIKMMGAASLTLIEPLGARRALASAYGADFTIDPASEDVVNTAIAFTNGRGYDVVIDCSGSPRAVVSLPAITAKGGKLIYAAMYPNDYEMPLNIFKYCYFNEISITGLYVAPYAFPRAAQIMPRMKLDEFTNTVFDIDDAEAAFVKQLAGESLKILIRCNKLTVE
jgi:(R,R)-butanediol dehydrogenase/meso-butanediol dehydrogenase/diacetyl reductase/L-iditol 2-dehydrogenase